MKLLGQRGFSLLEVLVAFAVLALSLGVLMQVFSRALTTTAEGGDYSQTVALAEARLNAVGVDIPLQAGSYTGDAEDGIAWQILIEAYDGALEGFEAPAYTPYVVTSAAAWGENGRQRRVTLVTLRLGEPL